MIMMILQLTDVRYDPRAQRVPPNQIKLSHISLEEGSIRHRQRISLVIFGTPPLSFHTLQLPSPHKIQLLRFFQLSSEGQPRHRLREKLQRLQQSQQHPKCQPIPNQFFIPSQPLQSLPLLDQLLKLL